MLFPITPHAAGEAPLRALFVGEKLWRVLVSPEGDLEWEQRVGELRADLEQFVTSPIITPKYLFLLFPKCDSVWEIRSVLPDPSIRVLGMFAEKDILILTEHALRKDLGGWQSRLWLQIKRNARAAWRTLFWSYDPMTSTSIADIVSGAIDGKYFKDKK
jgi:hypothetical protein